LVDAFKQGKSVTTSAKSKYARAWNIAHAALEESGTVEVFGRGRRQDTDLQWIPAHTTEADIGVKISAYNRAGNDVADHHCKEAAKNQRANFSTLASVKADSHKVEVVARWIGHAGVIANDAAEGRDSTASRSLGAIRRAARALDRGAPQVRATVLTARPNAFGGHDLVALEGGWKCRRCFKQSGSWNVLAPQRCTGSAATRWARMAAHSVTHGIRLNGGHTRWLSDDTVWCSTCGSYATDAAVGLTSECKPPLTVTTTCKGRNGMRNWTYVQRHTQLNRLIKGFHPISNLPFSRPAIPEHQWQTLPDHTPTTATPRCSDEATKGKVNATDKLRRSRATAAGHSTALQPATLSQVSPQLAQHQARISSIAASLLAAATSDQAPSTPSSIAQ